MSLKLLAPAAAMLLAGAVMASSAQAAPATGMPQVLKAAQAGTVHKANWYRHHHRHHYYYRYWRYHHHHHHRHHHHR